MNVHEQIIDSYLNWCAEWELQALEHEEEYENYIDEEIPWEG